ncbi:hypothetical protein GF420_15330 [candidate division GN15 bacterium]|nr:hypothetical protein [candidate division GN15 bacterium]
MKVLMGGPGSTGSSMLRTVLNRHPDVFSGAELNFFNKEQVFTDWPQSKHRLLGFKFPRFTTQGWFPYAGHHLLHEDYGWSREELRRLISDSTSLGEFVERYFARPMASTRAQVWVEKTPSNAYSFRHFLNMFADSKVVHTIRQPHDAVASLVRRGFTPIFATGMWVYNASAAMSVEDSQRYLLIKYEDLVEGPEHETGRLLDFLEVATDLSVLEAPGRDESAGIGTWGNRPDKTISKSSVGGFYRMPVEVQEEIVTALSLFRIADRHMTEKSLRYQSCAEICRALDYPFEPQPATGFRNKVKADLRREALRRSLRFYATGWRNFPAEIAQS